MTFNLNKFGYDVRQCQGEFVKRYDDILFYSPAGGYKVGRTRTFKLKIRTRSENGLLLYVGGNGDYVIIELVDGKVKTNFVNYFSHATYYSIKMRLYQCLDKSARIPSPADCSSWPV